MKKLVFTTLLCSVICGVWGNSFNVQSIIARMGDGQNIRCGKSPKEGIWIVARAIVVPEPGMSPGEVQELGLAMAKKEIAAFFGTAVRSSESGGSSVTIREANGGESSEQAEFFKEAVSVDVNQFLRGVSIVKRVQLQDEVHVYAFTSSVIMDAAAELADAKAALPPDTVMAIGISALVGEAPEIQRQDALASAKRFAVEQVLGTQLVANTQVQNGEKVQARIYAGAAGFIEEFRIESESRIDGGYRVRIIAKVARNKLMKNYSASLKAMGDPGFVIETNQKDLYMSLSNFFATLGVRVVPDRQNADYVIDAMGDFRSVRHPAMQDAEGVQLSLWVRIFDARTGQELFAVKNDPRKAAVFHAKGERQVELAAEKAYRQMKKPLHEKLNELLGKMAAGGREIRIVIDNYSDAFAPELAISVKAAEMIPGCSNVNVKIDAVTQQATIRANYTATMEALAKFMAARLAKEIEFPARRPKIQSVKNTELILSF